MQNYLKTLVLSALVLLTLDACVRFHSHPLSAKKNAAALESRSLTDEGLQSFIDKNDLNAKNDWPKKVWDLNFLTLAAFYYHPDMEIARGELKAAVAAIKTAKAVPNPTFSFAPQYITNPGSLSPWILGFNFDLPIETARKRHHRIVQAKHLSEAARYHALSTAWQVRSRVRAALIDFDMALQKEKIFSEEEKSFSENLRSMEEFQKQGMVSPLVFNEAVLNESKTHLAYEESKKQTGLAKIELATSLGLPVSVLEQTKISFDDFKTTLKKMNSAKIREEALTNRPDILAALSDYAACEANLQEEISKQYPDIHLGPGFAWSQGDHQWGLGFSLSLPIFNQNRGPIAEAKARCEQKSAQFTALQAKIIGEIDSALINYNSAFKKFQIANQLLKSLNTKYELLHSMLADSEAVRLTMANNELELDSLRTTDVDNLLEVQKAVGLLEDAIQKPLVHIFRGAL